MAMSTIWLIHRLIEAVSVQSAASTTTTPATLPVREFRWLTGLACLHTTHKIARPASRPTVEMVAGVSLLSGPTLTIFGRSNIQKLAASRPAASTNVTW